MRRAACRRARRSTRAIPRPAQWGVVGEVARLITRQYIEADNAAGPNARRRTSHLRSGRVDEAVLGDRREGRTRHVLTFQRDADLILARDACNPLNSYLPRLH
eukprot:scaffold28278_cov26-Tisochrysis_lutea.AAC.4